MSDEKINNENTTIMSELKKLANLQKDLLKVTLAKHVRDSRDAIIDGTSTLSSYLNEQAERFGREKKETEKLKQTYKNYVKDQRATYIDGVAALEMDKQDFQGRQLLQMGHVCVLKENLNQIKKSPAYASWKKGYNAYARAVRECNKNGDREGLVKAVAELKRVEKESPAYAITNEIREVENRIKDLDNQIKEKKEQQKELRRDFKTHVKEAWKVKNTELTNIKKQNFFQRFIGSITAKINGGKKFAEAVAKPIGLSLKNFGEKTLPAFANSVKEKAGNRLNEIKSFGNSIKDKIQGVVDRGVATKNNVIERVATRIATKNEITNAKIEQMNRKAQVKNEMSQSKGEDGR